MAEPSEQLKDPWLVAAWAGMGGVAVNAGLYLAQNLGGELSGEFPAQELFELQAVQIEAGLIKSGRLPRSMFLEWKDPEGRRDLVFFIGEAQPPRGGYSMCQRIVDYAVKRGVKQIVTFAAMATQLHPSTKPRVFGAATENDVLMDLRERDVEILKEGQISGLNGVLLAAGAQRGLPGICLLGELPFFAVGVPNPRSSLAVLEVFTEMAQVDLDLDEMREGAEEAEPGLLQLLEQMQQAAAEGDDSEFSASDFPEPPDEDGDSEGSESAKPKLDEAARRFVERLFRNAEEDRSKAMHLKEFLDRHGVFEQYEDRFLDLFRKAE